MLLPLLAACVECRIVFFAMFTRKGCVVGDPVFHGGGAMGGIPRDKQQSIDGVEFDRLPARVEQLHTAIAWILDIAERYEMSGKVQRGYALALIAGKCEEVMRDE